MPTPVATAPEPRLSVVVMVGRRRDRLERCLRGFLAQSRLPELEMILLDVAPEVPLPSNAHHPAIHHVPMPAETQFADARVEGIERARGGVIAFLEEHSIPLPGWADALIRAHEGPWAAVGPRMVCANGDLTLPRRAFLMSYGRFAEPERAGETALIPGHNSSYKRAVLRGYGPQLRDLLRNDNLLAHRLLADGHRLYLETAATVAHHNEGALATIWLGYRLYNRQYGHLRRQLLGWSLGRRLFYALATPLVPVYYIAHTLIDLTRRRSSERSVFLRGLPMVYITQLACALGQAQGLLFGPGDSERRFTEYELMADRPLPVAEPAA